MGLLVSCSLLHLRLWLTRTQELPERWHKAIETETPREREAGRNDRCPLTVFGWHAVQVLSRAGVHGATQAVEVGPRGFLRQLRFTGLHTKSHGVLCPSSLTDGGCCLPLLWGIVTASVRWMEYASGV